MTSYSACHDKICRLVVNGTETGSEYEEISFPQYSHDGKKIGFLGKRDNEWDAVVDGKAVGSGSEAIWGPMWGFSADDKHFFFAASPGGGESGVRAGIKLGLGVPPKERKWMWIVDGNPEPPSTVLSRITFSPDGSHYAYGASDVGKQGFTKQQTIGTVMVDGKPLAAYEGKGMAGKYAQTMVSGIRTVSEDFDGISTPQFDPEGRIVYAGRRDKGDIAVFVGSDPGPGFDEILSGIVFTSEHERMAMGPLA